MCVCVCMCVWWMDGWMNGWSFKKFCSTFSSKLCNFPNVLWPTHFEHMTHMKFRKLCNDILHHWHCYRSRGHTSCGPPNSCCFGAALFRLLGKKGNGCLVASCLVWHKVMYGPWNWSLQCPNPSRAKTLWEPLSHVKSNFFFLPPILQQSK
jgi:hypothetical protein